MISIYIHFLRRAAYKIYIYIIENINITNKRLEIISNIIVTL